MGSMDCKRLFMLGILKRKEKLNTSQYTYLFYQFASFIPIDGT